MAHDIALVAAEIVHDHDIARAKGGQEDFLDIGPKALAIDRPLDEPWRIDPVMAQGREEGRGLPAAVRNLGGEFTSAWRPSVLVQVSSMKNSRFRCDSQTAWSPETA